MYFESSENMDTFVMQSKRNKIRSMKYTEAKDKFIQAWGSLGTSWGINRTMAQIHALLLISPDALSTEDIMEQLNASRGNVNMNTRALMDWGLVKKELRSGERREFFNADKDIHKVAVQIIKERRKRELEPVIHILEELKNIEGDKQDKKIKALTDTSNNIKNFSKKINKVLETALKADENWFWGSLIKFLK